MHVLLKLKNLKMNEDFLPEYGIKKKFLENGINDEFLQHSISLSKKKGTIRGIHYQIKPFEESKIVRCTRGSIFDVIIDLRPDSKTFKKWCSFELTEDNYKMLYIPKGFAHGFQTLEDNTEVSYQISEFYHPEYAKGIRWDDKTFRIEWPLNVSLISENDLDYTPFEK